MSLLDGIQSSVDTGPADSAFTARSVIYVYVALAAAVLYDNITTLDLEIELIWKRPRISIVQVLFLVNRYLGNVIHAYAAIVLISEGTTSTRAK
ncbi:hypothetical protein B0H34DRAFT_88963 [Crassisporium funariophilum]|nr:hypothetical protein B0H34DRAFT_88963 [Crassisporium funariophilum]